MGGCVIAEVTQSALNAIDSSPTAPLPGERNYNGGYQKKSDLLESEGEKFPTNECGNRFRRSFPSWRISNQSPRSTGWCSEEVTTHPLSRWRATESERKFALFRS